MCTTGYTVGFVMTGISKTFKYFMLNIWLKVFLASGNGCPSYLESWIFYYYYIQI